MKAEGITIRLADEGEDLDSYREHLPQAFMSSPRPLFFLAEQGVENDVVGLASLRVLGGGKKKEARFQVWVSPEHRRKGAGRQLMQAVSQHAQAAGVSRLLAGVAVGEKSEEEIFFESLERFEVKRTLQYFEIKTADAWEVVAPLAKRIFEREKFNQAYEIVTLEQAKLPFVRDFVLKYLGGIPDALVARLRGGSDGFLPKLSVVIRSSQGPVGVLLIRKGKRGLVIDSRVVSPEVRGTWINVALMYTFAKNLRTLGIEQVYFEGDTQLHKDTIKLARRFGGKLVESNVLYGCDYLGGD
ncbi:MAG: GNAT family N-acetyltransferase [Verrucomicrobiales bacterium]|nr:GNAT family N-acetyltransferase [Verrucomicrobiales bacterium]